MNQNPFHPFNDIMSEDQKPVALVYEKTDDEADQVNEVISDRDANVLANAVAYALLGNLKEAIASLKSTSKSMSYGEALARLGIDDPKTTNLSILWKKITKPVAAVIKKVIGDLPKTAVVGEDVALDEEITSDIERIMGKLGESFKKI